MAHAIRTNYFCRSDVRDVLLATGRQYFCRRYEREKSFVRDFHHRATLTANAPGLVSTFSKIEVRNLQIRGGKAGEKPSIEEVKVGNSISCVVKAELNDRGELIVPGANYARDAAGIKNWMNNLSGHGTEGVPLRKERLD